MGLRIVSVVVLSALLLTWGTATFAQSKRALMDELSQARKNFTAERDRLHDQDRVLRIAWHEERNQVYKQLKENPGDTSLKERLNEGAKKFLADKREIYNKLEALRQDWLKQRADLGARIKGAQD